MSMGRCVWRLPRSLWLPVLFVSATLGQSVCRAALNRPVLAVGRCAVAPEIDGVLAPGEWAKAACGGGMSELGANRLLAVQPRFMLAFDDRALYFAAVVPVPEGARLVAKQHGRDSAVYQDDSVELFLDPGATRRRYCQFVVNSVGALFDARDGAPEWDSSGARAAAGLGQGQWTLELAIPWSDVDAGVAADGSRWGLNVGLNCPSRGKITGTWSNVKTGFREPASFGTIVFTHSGPVARVTGLESLVAGRGDLSVGLTGAGPAEVRLRAWPRGQEDRPCVDIRRDAVAQLTLAFQLPESVPGAAPQPYDGELRVVCGESSLWSQSFATEAASPVAVHFHAFPDTGRLEVELVPGAGLLDPGQHVCRVSIGPKAQAATRSVDVPSLRAGGSTTVAFEGADVPAGDVTVAVRVSDRAGRVVLDTRRDLTDPLAPWWLNDTTGAEDVILPPYQPLRTEDGAILPWNRSYRFTPCLLPAEVTTAGASVLAGPVVLTVKANGRNLRWQGAAPRMTEESPSRVVLDGSARCEAMRLSGTALVEYDGMIRVDLRLVPIGEPHIDELTLEVPLKAEHAEYLYHFPGAWRSVANSGKLPAAGFTHGFKPFVWLGDNDRGFSWFCESAENWLPEDREDAITIVREGDRVVLRLHVIRGETIRSPLTYTFGFEATPAKQPEKTVWDYRISHSGAFGLQKRPATAFGADIAYPADGTIRGDRGTAEMWIAPSVDSDPDLAGTMTPSEVPNVTLFWLDVDSKTNAGLFWCGPPQQLRIWVRVDDKVLTTLSVPVKWKRGAPHHVAFSWGDELRIYLDGELRGRQVYAGLMPKDLGKATLFVGKASPPLWVDEIRVSDVARTPMLDEQPYSPDAHTLLLDHLDSEIKSFQANVTQPIVGVGGSVHGAAGSRPGTHGRGVRLCGDRESHTALDHLAEAGVRTLCFHSQWSWMGYPMPRPGQEQELRDLVEACHGKGIQLLLYASPLTADQAPEWELYHRYFLIEPRKWPYRYDDGHLAPACCWQGRYRNLWLARQAKLIEEYDIDGFYLDGSEWPLDCRNERHGCGYKRRDGKTGTTCNIFGTRDYMKRLYVLCRSRKPDAQLNIHNSTVMVIPTLGWGTSSWGGEQLGSLSWDKGGAVEKQDYALDVLPLDAFRTEFMGRQWGVPSEFLCYERPYTTPQVLSITLLHHVLVRPNAAYLGQVSAIWKLHDRFGMAEATWHPYWANGDRLRPSPETIKVSAYRHARNGLLLLVANLSSEPANARVEFEAETFGLGPGGLDAVDAISGETAELTGQQVSLELGPFSYRYVWIK